MYLYNLRFVLLADFIRQIPKGVDQFEENFILIFQYVPLHEKGVGFLAERKLSFCKQESLKAMNSLNIVIEN